MNFHPPNRRAPRLSRRSVGLWVVAILIVALFALNDALGGAIADSARTSAGALRYAQRALASVGAYTGGVFERKRTLLRERDALKARVRELELYALNNMVLASENAELRALLGADADSGGTRGTLARVLSRGGSVPYGTVLLALEAATTPEVGAPVFGAHEVVIGHVARASDTTALVRLIAAPGEETPVFIGVDDTLTPATLTGVGSGNMVADVPRDAAVAVGDPVMLADGARALVGVVGSIETKPADARKTVRVRTPLNLATLRFVRVVW